MRSGQDRIYRGHPSGGFMLVEVLATMTISALVLAALFSVVSLTLRSSATIERRSETIEQRTRLIAALSREIERAVPVRWAGSDGAFIFSGTARSIVFAAETPSPGGSDQVAAIFLDSAAAVTRRIGLVESDARSFEDIAIGRPEIMVGKPYQLAFSYYARLPDGREALLENWSDPLQWPVAVRLTVSDGMGSASTIRLKLAVDAEPGCGLPETGRCSLAPATAPGEEAIFSLTGGGGG